MRDRGPATQSKPVNLYTGSGDEGGGSLRWCPTTDCDTKWTTRKRCPRCQELTTSGPVDET